VLAIQHLLIDLRRRVKYQNEKNANKGQRAKGGARRRRRTTKRRYVIVDVENLEDVSKERRRFIQRNDSALFQRIHKYLEKRRGKLDEVEVGRGGKKNTRQKEVKQRGNRGKGET